MEKKFYYITTPIYYVNDNPHIGHAYTNVICDILARFKKMDGFEVVFATGTDEHGQKVEKSANNLKQDPKQFVDKISENFRNLSSLLNLSNTDFIRTTEERHKKAAQFLWQELENKGYIYLGKYEGWYAIRDEAFYNEDELSKNESGVLVAPSGAEVEWREEESYFFKLSAFEDKLLKFLEENKKVIMPRFRYNEVVSFIKGGLKDLSISRTSFSWGIPVPSHDKHIMYVWLDALTNYLTVLSYPDQDGDFHNYWNNVIHIVGKDILRFHSIYWFAFLMGIDLHPPKRVFAHGWWLNEGQKISKSLGNIIDPKDLINKYGLDACRYFFAKEINLGNDGDFSHNAMVNKMNNELANEYGNLLQRSLSIIAKNFECKLENIKLDEEQLAYLEKTNEILANCRELIDNQDLQKYVDSAFEIIHYGNSYINDKAPWKLIKEDKKFETANILYFVCELLRRVSLLMSPIVPDSANNILDQLNITKDKRSYEYFNDSINQNSWTFKSPSVVFKKFIEDDKL